MNTTASSIIGEFQSALGMAVKSSGDGAGLVTKIETMGQEFLGEHFVDEAGAPRTDLNGVTIADIWAAKEILKLMLAPLGNPDNLRIMVKASGGRR